jgi:hypothetical protein
VRALKTLVRNETAVRDRVVDSGFEVTNKVETVAAPVTPEREQVHCVSFPVDEDMKTSAFKIVKFHGLVLTVYNHSP